VGAQPNETRPPRTRGVVARSGDTTGLSTRQNAVMTSDDGRDREFGFRTRAIHAGGRPDPTTGARAVPIYQTSSYVFGDTDEAANLFALQTYGNIYSRISNPTVAAFEERIASLEGGLGAIGTASGQSAEFLTLAALAGACDHLVASAQLYGGTRTLMDVTLARFGVETTFLAEPEPDVVAASITDRTRAVYVETIANPSGMIPDLTGLADVAHAAGVPLVVDSTMATPALCRPIEHGADLVLHSVTKFIGGHGTSIGGAIVESGRFPWDNGRFPLMTEPIDSYGGLSWWGNFGEYGFLTRVRMEQLRDVGAVMTPFNAFLFLMGLETLALRMRQHAANARVVADHLDGHPLVDWVAYSGLPDSPWFDRSQKYLPDGPGAVFSFGVVGGRAAGARFIEGCRLSSHLANIGDARTLVIHPASTTHQQLDDDALAAGGVTPDLVRISVGIEDADDICADLDQALHAAHEET
jgi:O-acetylhomoserine (thiol)-lyase